MSAMIDDTMQSVRRISSELRPKLLDDLGLSAALEWLAREFERHAGIACDIRSQPDDIVLDQARSTALFRIFQETLTNVARHAAATRVAVSLSRDGADAVEMVVQDDGRGITAEQVADAQSLGIIGMRERVRSLNEAGAFYVCEAEGCGLDEPAGDLAGYPVTTEVTEEARQAALAAAVAPVAKKRAPRRKAEAPAAEGTTEAAKAESRGGRGRAVGERPARSASAAQARRAPGRKAAASARPKRRPAKK